MARNRRGRKIAYEYRFYIIFLIIVFLISAIGMFYVRRIMLENARKMGQELSRSYLMEEEKNFTMYKNLIEIGAESVETRLTQDASEEELRQELLEFFSMAQNLTDEVTVDPYAVIHGQIIAANPWEGDETFDYSNAEWYQKAIEAEGQVIFTDGYMDSISQKIVITVAKQCGDGENVIAFDVFPENFKIHAGARELPEGGCYYLCDSKGTLLYKETILNADDEAIAQFVKGLFDKVQTGEISEAEDYIQDLNGKHRAVYSYETSGGWIGIFTMPYSTLLQEYYNLVVWYAVVFGVFILIAILMSVSAYILNKDIRRTNDTIRILGNSYYGIYRVDYKRGVYERIKGSDYSRIKLDDAGDYEELLTFISEQMEEKTREEFLDKFSLENVQQLLKDSIREFGGDFQRKFNGGYEWVNGRLLFDPSLGPEEMVLCLRNVEKEKEAQLQQMKLLEDALDAAKSSEESQQQFFANMSHDMRTPLNAVIGMSDMALREEKSQEKVRDYLEKINLSSKQLLNLINDILEISRLEHGRSSLAEEQFSIRTVLEQIVLPFQSKAEMEGKQFHISCDIREEMVSGDAKHLTQLMNNLLSNALKFTEAGDRIAVQLKQTESKDKQIYQISVSDTGVGMSEEFLPRLFQPYEREVRFGDNKITGTGLGMSITKSIVNKMGGKIMVESVLGEGTVFTLTLPFKAVPEQEKQTEEGTEGIEQPVYTLKEKRILLVEDYELNMEIATDILEMEGAVVTPAWNGREAVEVFAASEAFTYDAILMDMQMPEMSGCEATEAIRKLPREDAWQIPIVAVTANAFAEDIALTRKSGMDAHISKPIDVEVLCQTVGELIEKRNKEK